MAPKPSRAIGWARAAIETAYGPIRIDWRLEDTDALAMKSSCRLASEDVSGRR